MPRRRTYSDCSSDCSCSCSECDSSSGSSSSSSSSEDEKPAPLVRREIPPQVDVSGAAIVQDIKFLISRLPTHGFAMAIASRRGSGKTVLVSQLITQMLKINFIDMAIVLSGSSGLNDDYTDVLPKELIRPYNEEFLERLWDKQAKVPKARRQSILVVADDILSDPKAQRSEMIMKIYTQGRHNGLQMILLSQSPTHVVSPIVRQNSDICMWSALNRRSLAILWEATSGISKNDFFEWAERNTGNYRFLCIDTGCMSAKPDDFLFVCRAKTRK